MLCPELGGHICSHSLNRGDCFTLSAFVKQGMLDALCFKAFFKEMTVQCYFHVIIISARLPEIQGWPKVGSGNTGNEEINEEMRGMQLAGIPVIPVIIIGVMRISYNERAVSQRVDFGTICSKLCLCK